MTAVCQNRPFPGGMIEPEECFTRISRIRGTATQEETFTLAAAPVGTGQRRRSLQGMRPLFSSRADVAVAGSLGCLEHQAEIRGFIRYRLVATLQHYPLWPLRLTDPDKSG